MKQRTLTVLVTVLMLVSAFTAWKVFLAPSSRPGAASASPVFDRVLQRGELRVAYLVLPPYLDKSTASGKLSGIFYDTTEELGRRLGLKVVWVEEANLATLSAGFDAGRYDMIAFPLWRSASRAKNVSFSAPLFYSTVGVYVRQGNSRFDGKLSLLNDPNVKVSAADGELAADIAKSDFPKATVSALPNLTDYSQMLLEVATSKADVTFFNRVFAARFMKQNPGKVKDITGSTPIRVFAECYVLPLQDATFREMINNSVLEMVENGAVDRAFQVNGENPEEYFRPALPYRPPTIPSQ